MASGGVSTGVSSSNGTINAGLTASTTGALTFTPGSTFDGTISAISVKISTGTANSILNINDQSGTLRSELRVNGTNLGLGLNSLRYTTSGTNNSAYGTNSLASNATGYGNAASGTNSLQYNTTGYQNTASGSSSLQYNTTGFRNTASGYLSLVFNTTGYGNSAFGYSSIAGNTTGSNNTASGYLSLYNNTAGYSNTASGYISLYANTSGYFNTGIGYATLFNNTTGYVNTAIGYFAGDQGGTQTQFKTPSNIQYSTMLGAFSQAYANNVVALGSQGADTVKVGIGTGLPSNQLSAESYRTSTGSVTTDASANIVGTGTSFTSDMVGNVIYIATNSTTTAPYLRTITAYTDATHITVSATVPALTNAQYYINYVGLQVSTIGNVGVGTLSPGATLDVYKGNLRVTGYFYNDSPIYTTSIYRSYPSMEIVNRAANGALGGLHIYSSGHNSGTFLSSGQANSGYWTTGVTLHVGDGSAYRAAETTGSAIVQKTGAISFKSGTGLTVGDNSVVLNTNMTILANGNVGIGTIAPANKLSVNTLATADPLAQVAISAGGAGNRALVVQASVGQTADMLQVQASNGAATFYVAANGVTAASYLVSSNYVAANNGSFVSSTNSGNYQTAALRGGNSSGTWAPATGSTAGARTRVQFNPSSGDANLIGADITPVINTSGTYAGNSTALRVSPYLQSTTGVATNLLLDLGTNSAPDGSGVHSSVFTIQSTGTVTVAGNLVTPTWTAQDHGMLTWTFDIVVANASVAPTAGTVHCAKVHLPRAVTVTNILMLVQTAGASLTTGQCFAALYNGAGALLSATADQSVAWASTGTKTMALTAPQAVAAGDYYVAIYANGATPPAFCTGTASSLVSNFNLAQASYRYFAADTGRTTTMPANLIASSSWTSCSPFWAGLS